MSSTTRAAGAQRSGPDNATLCEFCQDFINRIAYTPRLERLLGLIYEVDRVLIVLGADGLRRTLGRLCRSRYQSAEDLVLRASRGCALCDLVLQRLSSIEDWRVLYPLFTFSCHSGLNDSFSVDYDEFSIIADGTAANWHLDLLAIKTEEHVELNYNKKTYRQTWSDQSVDQVRRWLHVCRTEHENCNKRSNRPAQFKLPKRLLLVKASEQLSNSITLIDSRSLTKSVRYATLSHAWGNVKRCRLLQDNLKAYERGIAKADLPLTFREAVEVCQTLDIDYLWIDSLCILQDSDADWTAEAARMAEIYSNALLTIAATASADDDGGLFRSPKPQKAMPLLVTARGGTKRQTSYHLHYEDDFEENVDAAPLNRRAWVLQERYLAARTIHFAENQLYWQCPSALLSLSDNTNTLVNHRNIYNFDSIDASEGKLTLPVLENWTTIVEAFSQAKLTRASDKLVALSGLARRAHELLRCAPSDYLAGLWRQELPASLLWHTAGGVKSEPYRAPSWCSTSLDGEIHCTDYGSSDTLLVEVLNASVDPIGDPFGAVGGGSILLRGHLCKIALPKQLGMTAFTKDSPALPVVKTTVGHTGHVQVGTGPTEKLLPAQTFTVLFDHRRPPGHNSGADPVIYFLPIVDDDHEEVTDNEEESAILAGLMLEPTGKKKGQFHRVGQLTFNMRTACNVLRTTFDARNIPEDLYQDLDGDDWYTIEII